MATIGKPHGSWPEGALWRAYMARTEPGGGAEADDKQLVPGTSSIKFKSIPSAPTGRLLRRLAVMHEALHTPEGLHVHDGPRRELINQGVKLRCIVHELRLRGVGPGTCNACWDVGQ